MFKSLLSPKVFIDFSDLFTIFSTRKRQWQLSLKSVSIVQPTFWKIGNIFVFKLLPATFPGIPTTSWSCSSSVLRISPALTFHSYNLFTKLNIYILSNNYFRLKFSKIIVKLKNFLKHVVFIISNFVLQWLDCRVKVSFQHLFQGVSCVFL